MKNKTASTKAKTLCERNRNCHFGASHFKLLYASLILLAALFILPIPAQAAIKKLTQGQTYKIDLNGGAKEKFYYKVKKTAKGQAILQLYVNGKRVLNRTIYAPGENKNSKYKETTYVSSVKLVDVNQKNKYKEFFVDISGDMSDYWVYVIRYYGPSKVRVYTQTLGYTPFAKNGRVCTDYMTADNKGKVFLNAETPYYTNSFGCYYILVPMKLTTKKMVFYSSTSYRIVGVKDYAKQVFGENYYILDRSMQLYTSQKRTKKAGVLSGGTRFTPIRIAFVNLEDDAEGYEKADVCVYVKTREGKKGWLLFPKNEDGYLTSLPAWG